MSDLEGTARAADEGHPSLWRNRNFLRLFLGRLVTNAGDSLYSIAILWLVFERSGSTFLTGVASSLLLLPFVLQIVSGPIVDRVPIKPLLVGSQVAQGAIVLVLPAAAYAGTLTVELVLATIPALSVLNQLIRPAQSAVVPRIVAERQLARSNSALATVTLGLDVIFQAFGGLLIAAFGVMTLFLVDSLTFLVAGLLFLGMVIPAAESDEDRSEMTPWSEYLDDLRRGVEILRGTAFVEMILTAAAFNFAVGVSLAILPAFGELRGGPAIYGLLLGALGTGRLVGSISASYLETVPYGRLKTVTYVTSAVCWFGSVYSPSLVLTVGLFGLAWISAGIDGVLVETMTQKVFPAEFLGRVSAIRGAASTVTLPLGSLVGGYVAEGLGTTTTLGLAALGFGVAGLYFALRPPLRRLPAVGDVDPAAVGMRLDRSPAATDTEGEEGSTHG